MTTEGAVRPSVDGGPPTSRFLEGSMNDRTSAAPPVQFLGPEEADEFERQFYRADAAKQATQRAPRRTRSISRRRERPMSAQAQLQSLPYATLQLQDEQKAMPPPQQDDVAVADMGQKKPGLLGRVREALFGKGATAIVKPVPSNVQNEIDKRTSLQQAPSSYTITKTVTTPQTRPIPIPLQKGVTKAQSSSHIPQLPASFQGGGGNMNDRPSKEEIMASYNELMATGFFKAHAIQSTRQPAPGSLPNSARRPPPMPTIPSPDRPSMDQSPTRPSFSIIPPSPPTGYTLPIPPMPSNLPPPPPLLTKPSWGSFREGLRGRKRNRADSSDDNASESTSMRTPSLSAGNQLVTQVGGIGRRVSKKLRKMPSALASQLQAKSDGMIRVVPATDTTTDNEDRAVRLRSPSPAAAGFKTSSSSGSIPGRLRKRNGNGTSRPPITLDNYAHLNPRRVARGGHHPGEPYQQHTANWEPMDIDGGHNSHSVRGSMDSIQHEHEFENVGQLLRDGQLGLNMAEPLSVVPDMNRGIPSVPQIPRHYKHHSTGLEENFGVAYGQAL